MEINIAHNKFMESFKIEPGRLLQALSEQKGLLLDEFNRLNKSGVISDNAYKDLMKRGSKITAKYFPEYFPDQQDESQNSDN